MRSTSAVVSACLAAAPGLASACWDQAGERYGVSPSLLYAIARVESGLNPSATNLSHRQRTGTYDIGLMQINSSHLPALASLGISEAALRDPCTNILVGAWLLAKVFAQSGVSWDSVGAYNAACTQLKGDACQAARRRYAWRVYRHLPGSKSAADQQSARADAVPVAAKVSP